MMNGGMMDGMGSMMAWMMGLGLLGWVLVVGLLATIVFLLVRILRRTGSIDRPSSSRPTTILVSDRKL